MFKEKLRSIIDSTSNPRGKAFNIFIQVLIIFSVVAHAIETEPGLNKQIFHYLYIAEIIVVIIFTIEYALRIYVAKNKWKYIFSFYGLIDIIAILPFYLTFGLEMTSVRVFRIFRIFRVLKLTRYNKALNRLEVAYHLAKEELYLFLVMAGILLYFSAAGIYFFEHQAQPQQFKSIFSSLWWAVGTLTTVGYGDVYPITAAGKVFTFFILIIGLGVVAVPAALLAEGLAEARHIEKAQPKKEEPTDTTE